ncbi:SnoaL-like domain protein [Corynebacterium atrinae]|uniref:nuclear transport factor 2 family protein n=1 Tax=Corynebacterium atrinae TaxID=1336740 RepID=UPI0025B629E7|nr:nuclear transport factor 2 family protein [Corynebacterium atrinae]WJY63909.1 SnoaL-like domain protein [Corynebacterium atrinae]
MYKLIVRSKVREMFDQINSGNFQSMVDKLAPSFNYRLHGDHALGGRRTTRASMITWWNRVFDLFPGAQYEIHDILVNGWPWRTRIAVRALFYADLPNGERYENTVFEFLTLSWGKVIEVETVEDIQLLKRALAIVADAGNTDALAAPISDL